MTQALSYRQQFRPQNRLHFPWEFRRFYNQSVAFRYPGLTILKLKNETGVLRLGISVSSKWGALPRNRAKRLFREFFRTHQNDLGAFDYHVIIPKKQPLDHSYFQGLPCLLRERFLPVRPPSRLPQARSK